MNKTTVMRRIVQQVLVGIESFLISLRNKMRKNESAKVMAGKRKCCHSMKDKMEVSNPLSSVAKSMTDHWMKKLLAAKYQQFAKSHKSVNMSMIMLVRMPLLARIGRERNIAADTQAA